ncbi:hypothetical protein [Pseudomonas sp. 31 R 17]|nr:hypothetical protein [Pseudomonas sp. 31 R 17]
MPPFECRKGACLRLFVGASLLAKNVNDNAYFLNERGACEFFASKLAPTDGGVRSHSADPVYQ